MASSSHFDFELDPKLGDGRLNRRLKKIVDQLSKQPTASVPQAQGNWADTNAAYRFWDNAMISPHAILAARFVPTIARIGALKEVLAIQDTSTFATHGIQKRPVLGTSITKKATAFMFIRPWQLRVTECPLDF